MGGYFGTQKKLFHMIILSWSSPDEVDTSDYNTQIDDHELGNYIYVSEIYVSSSTDFGGDKEFAASVATYDISDHGGYFVFDGRFTCGYDAADSFLHTSNVAELFYL